MGNTNAWILLLTYGLCFGVELTMNNKMTSFFNRYYAIRPRQAGVLGALFSLMNLFARSWGGILSDYCAKYSGMRGRLTSMWIIQTLNGMMCLFLGLVTINLKNPDSPEFKGEPKVLGIYTDDSAGPFGIDSINYYINGSLGEVKMCGSKEIRTPYDGMLLGSDGEFTATRFPLREGTKIMIKDPRPDCIHNGNTLGTSIILVMIFSIFVQMAEGLHFGVGPKINRPAGGVIAGMVGAGGNFGALISGQFIIGSGTKAPLDEGFIYLGIIIMTLSLTHLALFFPGEGGIILPKNFPYDPQWIKPLEGAKGSDELDFTDVKTSSKSGTTTKVQTSNA